MDQLFHYNMEQLFHCLYIMVWRPRPRLVEEIPLQTQQQQEPLQSPQITQHRLTYLRALSDKLQDKIREVESSEYNPQSDADYISAIDIIYRTHTEHLSLSVYSQV